MRRLISRLLGPWLRRPQGPSRSARPHDLTAVEYEAVTLIAYEGQTAYARACEQARYCREKGSETGFRFWSEVAAEVALRTTGRIPERR